MFYRIYAYAPGATLVSALSGMAACCSIAGGGMLIGMGKGRAGFIIGGIALIALAVIIYIYGSRIIPDRIARKQTEKNIKTKAVYAFRYCMENPEAYEQLIVENKNFASKYIRNDEGKIVRL